ncbi:MAG: Do family serine endopeptidase [Phycisphaerales bacterium]|nr:MAG: Do family serine endopeptidase [Phycisphaerales bacterium]
MRTQVIRRKRRILRHFVIPTVFVLLFVVPLSGFAAEQESIAALRQMGKAFASIAEKTSPAVVGIKAEKEVSSEDYPTMRQSPYGNPFDEDLFEYFFRRRSPRRYRQTPRPRQVAQGSGFIISTDGYILTNNHLVGEAEEITVRLADDRKFTAKLIGTDPESEVALVKIDADDLPVLKLADSDALEVGEWVIAIGNPFGLTHTVTAGIVSAKGRSNIGVASYEDFIQTDAAINFGNSGGPLLNLDGEAVGINTAIIGPGGNVGIGLAIPINMAKAVQEQLLDTGKVVRGFLGVGIQDFDPEMSELLDQEGPGVIIQEVTEGSAAEDAGVKVYDVVVELDGEPVDSANDFRNRVAMHKPGTKIELTVVRDGKRKTIKAKLGKRPEGDVAAAVQSEVQEQLGLSVHALTDDLARRLGYEGLTGVVVTEVQSGSLAQQAGITSGALIMEVDRQKIENVRQFNEAIRRAREKGKVLLWIKDENYKRLVPLTLPKE